MLKSVLSSEIYKNSGFLTEIYRLTLPQKIWISGVSHGVSIILIVTSNMSCINVLTSTHNLSIDRKLRVHPHACLKSLLYLIWTLE